MSNIIGIKKCKKCKKFKEYSEFYIDNSNNSGLRYSCKKCDKENQKEYRERPEVKKRSRVLVKKWRKDNPEQNKKLKKKWEQSPKGKYNEYKKRSRERNIIFNLTFEQFITFWQKDCEYCGDKIDTIGLDRVDNKKGYNIDNVESCCTQCNTMKMDYTEEEFINKCLKITKKYGKI